MSLNNLRNRIPRFTIASGIGVTVFSTVGLVAPSVDIPMINQIPGLPLSQSYAVPQRLSDSDIQSNMQDIPDWELNGHVIQSQRQFRDFVEAIAFVNRLVAPAEAASHHPDIAISYNTVTITLTTHDVGGLTEQDFALAAVISDIQ